MNVTVTVDMGEWDADKFGRVSDAVDTMARSIVDIASVELRLDADWPK